MKAHRDILVLGKTFLTEEEFQLQMKQLETIITAAEESIAQNEILNLNNFKLITDSKKIAKLLARPLKPFVFLINNN